MRIPFAVLIAFSSLSLHADQAPAEVDGALRARVNEFFTMQLNHQFRQAEALVAEDTKDFYYEAKKPNFKSFRIDGIEYSSDLQTAVVTIRGKNDVLFAGAGIVEMDFAERSKWKIENGKWCWYFDKDSLLNTPFGRVKAAPSDGAKPPSDGAGPVSPLGPFRSPSAAALRGGAVQVDRAQIQLDAGNPQPAVINLKNNLPGPVNLTVIDPPQGLKISIARPELAAGEATQVTIMPDPNATDRPTTVLLRAQPVNQIISIAIAWAPGPVSPLGPFRSPSAAELRGGAVQVDRAQIQLDDGNPQPAVINLKNILPGPVYLSVVELPPGLKVSIARPELAIGEATQVTFMPDPVAINRPATLRLLAQPGNQIISIAIAWPPGPVSPLGPSSAAELRAVEVDRAQIQLDDGNPQPVVINLKNILRGPVYLSVVETPRGLKISIARPNLAIGESTQVTVTPDPVEINRPSTLRLLAQPVGQIISIAITWAP